MRATEETQKARLQRENPVWWWTQVPLEEVTKLHFVLKDGRILTSGGGLSGGWP